MHGGEGVTREAHLALAPGDHDAVPDVLAGLGEGQRREVVTRGHPLRQLPQLVPRQEVAQLGLAHQHDLDELLGVRLQVGDEPDLLEHLRREVLGFVDQQDDVASRRARLQEEAVEGVHEALLRGAVRRDVEVVEDRAQELVRGEGGVEHEGGVGVRAELREEVAGECRLPGSHLPGDEDEPAALAPAELEVGERLRVPL